MWFLGAYQRYLTMILSRLATKSKSCGEPIRAISSAMAGGQFGTKNVTVF